MVFCRWGVGCHGSWLCRMFAATKREIHEFYPWIMLPVHWTLGFGSGMKPTTWLGSYDICMALTQGFDRLTAIQDRHSRRRRCL